MSAPATPPTVENGSAAPDTLTITVLDTATIFEGPDTVYRYDLPGTGVTEGWALAAVIDQAKELCSLHWPEVEIIIDADEPTTELLTRTLLNKGVAAYPTEALRETTLPTEPEDHEVEITRPTTGGRHRFHGGGLAARLGLHPFHLAIVAVIVAVGAVSWWAIDNQSGRPAPGQDPDAVIAAHPGPGERAGEAAAAEDPTAPDPAPGGEEPDDAAEPSAGVVLEHSGLRLAAPVGFHVDNRGDALLATGDDPDLRIHLAADPVHNVPAEAVHREIETMVAEDPTLDGFHRDEDPGRGDEVLVYQELPGDGSEVAWSTWVAAGHQFSVGCHTRTTPTLPQQAACRMAVESLSMTG